MPNGRRGVTLLELVVALGLFGAVATLILSILRSQHRFYVASLEIIDTKRSTHYAVDVLSGALRGTSGADIYAISDSSIAFRAVHGATVVCAVDSARTGFTIPGHAAGARGLVTFLTLPRAGDSLLVFHPGDAPSADDDRWSAHILTSDPRGGICPFRPFGLAAHAAEAAGVAMTVSPGLSTMIQIGSPIRFFRPTRYSLYRSSTSEWMLGYSACSGGSCSVRQPLSGPYLPHAIAGDGGGLTFEYFDADGALTMDPRRVTRVDVAARARSMLHLEAGHLRGQRYTDSLAVTIGLRNS